MDAAGRRCRGFRSLLERGVGQEGAEGAAVFFREAIVGKDPPNESGTDGEALLGYRLGDLIHIAIGLAPRADDERLDLLGAFRADVWPPALGQERFGRACEDRVAAVVIGFACLEAEAVGELAFGEAAEFSEGNHADLLLDGLFLGEGDGFAITVSEDKRAIFDLHGDVERDMHDHPFPCGEVKVPRALQSCIRNYGTRSRAKHRGRWAA